MARFLNGTTDILRSAINAATAVPLTIACWFQPTTLEAATYNLVWLGISTGASTSNQFSLKYSNQVAGNMVQVFAYTAAGLASQAVVTAPLNSEFYLNNWVHCAGVFAATNNRIAYFNGVSGVAQTTNRVPASINRTSLGAADIGIPTFYTKGSLSTATIWNIALTQAEVALLATGVSPSTVRPGNILGSWPLFGADSPEPDCSTRGNRLSLSLLGSPSIMDDPPLVRMYRSADMIRQLGQKRSIAAQAAPPGGNPVFNAGWNRNNNKLIGCGVY